MVFDERMGSLESAAALGAAPRVLRLASIEGDRGTLTAADSELLPFPPVRYFHVRDVPPGAVRAGHALRQGEELLSCPVGGCTVEVWWRAGHAVHRLADPETALHLPPWAGWSAGSSRRTPSSSSSARGPTTRRTTSTDFAEFEAGPPRQP